MGRLYFPGLLNDWLLEPLLIKLRNYIGRLFLKYDLFPALYICCGAGKQCRLLGDLCRCAHRSLSCYFEAVTGSALTPGVIAAIQTFGDRINLHVHLHFQVTEGGTDEAAFRLYS